MKEAFTDMIGNLQLRERLRDDILSDRLSHAYLIEGAPGTGKHTLARLIAAALACTERGNENLPLPCCRCAACRKVLSGNSPDLYFLNRGDKVNFGVESIRDLRSDVLLPPNELPAKIYVLEEAHLLTVQAQNAFLLTLEEPPPYILFLLLCEDSAGLLETIRSRAPTLRTEPLTPGQIADRLCRSNPEAALLKRNDPSLFSEIIAAADGSVGQAELLLDPKRRKPIEVKRANTRAFLRLSSTRGSAADTLLFLNSLGSKREELVAQFNSFLLALRDLLLCKQTENPPLCFFADPEEAHGLAETFTAPGLLALADCANDAIAQFRINANVRLTMTSFAVAAKLL